MSNTQITLYPSNWLYNAGVIGFLASLIDVERVDIDDEMLPKTGELCFRLPFFVNLKVKERYFGNMELASIVGNNILYRNYLQSNQKELFAEFVKSLDSVATPSKCDVCGMGWSLKPNDVSKLNKIDPGTAKFLDRINKFNIVHNTLLGPSVKKFPNAFWSLRQSSAVCHLCSFLIIHHHLALTRLSDGSEIFINAPSFKVMYYLNKFAKEALGTRSSLEALKKREILAISVIEYATKINKTLGIWTGMNLEIVSRKRDKIEFFSLPHEVIQLLSDRNIATQLNQIGEFKILNLVLKQQYARLIELGYRLLRISLGDNRGTQDNSLIRDWLYLDRNKQSQNNLRLTAENILHLYALIEFKLKRSKFYEYTRSITA